jgi:MFS family permease
MGFENSQAQLMSCPPYLAATVSIGVFALLSDRFYIRMPFVAVALGLVITAFTILVAVPGQVQDHVAPTMAAMVAAYMGFYPILPVVTSWTANNLAPASRRAVGVAFLNSVAALSGIFGSFLFPGRPENYDRGFRIALGLAISALAATCVLEWSYKWDNARKARLGEDNIRAAYTEDQLLGMGDKSPLFRYTL